MVLLMSLPKPAFTLLNRALVAFRRQQSWKIPTVELSAKHIANLRVMLNRDALLESLPAGAVVAEVGVDHGDFSSRILEITRPARLHLIDAWDSKRYHGGLEHFVRERFAREIGAGCMQLHRGFSTTVLAEFPDGHFDWIYVDTDHSYETTKRELEIARSKMKPNGVIAGHDFVTGNWNSGFRYGVVEAVHEFCLKHDWELIALTHETDRHLSFAIRAIGIETSP